MIKVIEITSNIILTLALTVFAFLQWKAIEKQNKLTLFSARIQFYSEINDIIWKILFTFMDLKEGDEETKDRNISDICLLYMELNHNLLKTQHLFNQEIRDKIDAFIKASAKCNGQLREAKDFAKIDIMEVFQKSDDIKTIFEDFFKKNSK